MSSIYVVVAVFLLPFFAISQQTLRFQYDQAGNQIKREVCINCLSKARLSTKEADSFSETIVSYFPNPVVEELHLDWKTTSTKKVVSLEVYSSTGFSVFKFLVLDECSSKTLSFSSLPAGLYLLSVFFSNGEQQSLKILKR